MNPHRLALAVLDCLLLLLLLLLPPPPLLPLLLLLLPVLPGCTKGSEEAARRPSGLVAKPPGPGRAARASEAGFIGVLVSGHAVDVAAELEGQVRRVLVRLGEPVERGGRIALIDDRLVRQKLAMARAALQAAVAQEAKARLEQEEAQQRLARRQEAPASVSGEEMETARFKHNSSRAETRISSARVAEEQARVEELGAQLAKAVVRAPFAGSATLRYVDEGSVVKPGQAIVRLLSTSGHRIRFAVPPEDAALASVDRAIRVLVPALELTLAGKITHAAREVDPASQLVFVEAEVQVPAGEEPRLKAGLVGRVFLDAHPVTRSPARAQPARAVPPPRSTSPGPGATRAGSPGQPAAPPAGSLDRRAPGPALARP